MLGLDPHQLREAGRDVRLGAVARRVAEKDLLVAEQAGLEVTVGGQPHSVAALADVLVHRGDEADLAAGAGQPCVLGRAEGVEHRQLADAVRQRELFGQAEPAADLFERQHADHATLAVDRLVNRLGQLGRVGAAGERHDLDEPHGQRAVDGQLPERLDLVVVEPTHGDDVDPRGQVEREGRVDGGEDLLDLPAAGDLAELVRVEGIEAEVDPAQAAGPERLGVLGKADAVGGQAELLEPEGAELLDQGHAVAADQRLAAGDAHLAHAQALRHADDADNLLVAEDGLARLPLHALGGHAVDTAQVAPIGDRDAQVGDGPPKRVDQPAAGLSGCLHHDPSPHCASRTLCCPGRPTARRNRPLTPGTPQPIIWIYRSRTRICQGRGGSRSAP